MGDLKKALLQTPEGTESFSLEEALLHKSIVGEFGRVFSSWGYMPTQTPSFDFYDIYSNMIKNEDVYRLIDRDGDLLLLRNDITLFLAKQLSNSLDKSLLPARVFYADTILRHQNHIDISKNEFFQTGAELIGVSSERGELEVLLLLLELLEIIDLDFFIHIGSQKLFNLVFNGEDSIKNSILKRDKIAFFEAAKSYDNLDKLFELFFFIGDSSEFEKLISSIDFFDNSLGEEVLDELNFILKVVKDLEALKWRTSIRVDLSTLGRKSYYTGIVFEVFTSGADSSVASGGRYDKLLSNFGFDVPSIGFSIMQRKIEALLDNNISLEAKVLNGDNIIEDYKKAKDLRANGEVVKLC